MGRMKQYRTILMDPPWKLTGGHNRGADAHYDLMTQQEILDFSKKEVEPLIHRDAHLYLWVANNFLQDGLDLMKALGFRYITNVVWVKDKIGMGRYFRSQHELCLFGVKGAFYAGSVKERSVIQEPRTEHSKKPWAMYPKMEEVSQPPRLEVFSRHKRRGWDTIGNKELKDTQETLI